MQPVLGRGRDARLMRTPERHRSALPLDVRVVALGGHRGARGYPERGPGGPGSDRGEHRPPRQTRRLRAGLVGRGAHAPTTVPATLDRGSASASIVELRVRVSVSLRSVYSTNPLPSR